MCCRFVFIIESNDQNRRVAFFVLSLATVSWAQTLFPGFLECGPHEAGRFETNADSAASTEPRGPGGARTSRASSDEGRYWPCRGTVVETGASTLPPPSCTPGMPPNIHQCACAPTARDTTSPLHAVVSGYKRMLATRSSGQTEQRRPAVRARDHTFDDAVDSRRGSLRPQRSQDGRPSNGSVSVLDLTEGPSRKAKKR